MKSNFEIEVDLLLEAIYIKHGYDYRQYAKASIMRRINNFLIKEKIEHVGDLTHRVLENREVFKKLLYSISVTVTEMFRDPLVYQFIRQKIIPYLNTYPEIRVWHAGCATGQEAYSLAVLLYEEGLYDKTRIYATDINDESLNIARDAIYNNEDIRKSTSNYLKSGGVNSFSDYYHTKYNKSVISKKIKENITFITHNLVQDGSFNRFNFIMCRNVLIYFSKELQVKVIDLFASCLVPNGFLCLGTKESLEFIDKNKYFVPVDTKLKIYKKIKF